jgi:hypothetical protein
MSTKIFAKSKSDLFKETAKCASTSAASDVSKAGKNRESKPKKIEAILRENIRNEFGIGMTKILYNPHILIKLFWFVALALSLAMSVYFTVKLFLDFYSYDVKTNVRVIFETPTLFPQVNICNQNPITTKNGYEASLNVTFSNDLGIFSVSEKTQLSHSFNDILLSCNFNNLPCTVADFVWYFDRNWGNCYAFNSGFNSTGNSVDLLSSIRAGGNYGLQMTLYSGYYENLSSTNRINGLIVKLANQSFIDLSDGVFVSPGFVTNIGIERYFELLMPKPYSNCDIPNDWSSKGYSDLFNYILNSPYQYSQELCLSLCYIQDVIASCKCNPYDYPVCLYKLKTLNFIFLLKPKI